MLLARFLNKIFKKDGFILIDADKKKYIIGEPKKKEPISIKLLDKKLHYKLLINPDYILVKLTQTEVFKLKMQI